MRALYRSCLVQYFNQHTQENENEIKAAVNLQVSMINEVIDYFLSIKDKAGILSGIFSLHHSLVTLQS